MRVRGTDSCPLLLLRVLPIIAPRGSHPLVIRGILGWPKNDGLAPLGSGTVLWSSGAPPSLCHVIRVVTSTGPMFLRS